MTINISDNNPRISYTATSGQTAFTVPFVFFNDADLNVYINDTLKTITTNYTVTGGDGSTGSITLTSGATAGDIVVITRDVALERTTDFPSSGPFQVASLNTELDTIIAMVADMEDLAERGLRLSDSDTSASLVLADKDARKGTVLAFNATTGAVEVGPTIADTETIASIKADIATLADIEDGTDATDAIQTVAGISSNVTTVAGISSDVTTVAGNNANVTTVAGINANVTTVAGISANVTTVAGISSDVTSVAGDATDIGTVATNIANVNTVAANNANITTVAGQTTNMQNITDNLSAVQNAATNATNAATSASNASTSESNAAASAASAAASFDAFDDRYLGAKSSDPATDNDGDALDAGDQYFNTTDNELKVYNGSAWQSASVVGGTVTSLTTSSLDANGGTIDGTVIGGTTPAAGTFTTLTASGDVNFDSNTLFVDASANAVGIGTNVPDTPLEISVAGSGATNVLKLTTTGEGTVPSIVFEGDQGGTQHVAARIRAGQEDASNGNIIFEVEDAGSLDEAVRIMSDGSVGIGTSSPSYTLDTLGSGAVVAQFKRDASGGASGGIRVGNNDKQFTFYVDNSNGLTVYDGSTERLAVDTSGNLLVGMQSSSGTADGLRVIPNDFMGFTTNATDADDRLVLLNRQASDGTHIEFRKANSIVGSIGNRGSNVIHIGNGDTGLEFHPNDDAIYPTNVGSASLRDNGIDLGGTDYRFKDLYLGGRARAGGSTGSPAFSHHTDTDTGMNPDGSGNIQFTTQGSERMRIDSSGNVQVGTTSATGKFNVTRGDNGVGAYIFASPSSGYTSSVFAAQGNQATTNETYNLADFLNSTGSGRCKIYDSGDIDNTNGAYGSLSDVKLKTDIVDATSQWDDIKALRFRKYKMIADPDERVQMGLIAQELEATSPNLVKEVVDRDLEGNDLGTTTKSVKYSILYTKAVKALQEAMERIETLEAKVTALENA